MTVPPAGPLADACVHPRVGAPPSRGSAGGDIFPATAGGVAAVPCAPEGVMLFFAPEGVNSFFRRLGLPMRVGSRGMARPRRRRFFAGEHEPSGESFLCP